MFDGSAKLAYIVLDGQMCDGGKEKTEGYVLFRRRNCLGEIGGDNLKLFSGKFFVVDEK